jgi:hypothetical protein
MYHATEEEMLAIAKPELCMFKPEVGGPFKAFRVCVAPFYHPPRRAHVVRVTRNWIVVYCNEFATMKYRRCDGESAGAYRDRASIAMPRIPQLYVDFINAAVGDGKTWDGGFKPMKRKG